MSVNVDTPFHKTASDMFDPAIAALRTVLPNAGVTILIRDERLPDGFLLVSEDDNLMYLEAHTLDGEVLGGRFQPDGEPVPAPGA